MSWQKEAVEAAAKEIDETHIGGMDDARKLAEIVLRAALPLIEVTPGMVVACTQFADGSIEAQTRAMLRCCAEEGTDG
jgi:hypothetical protein